MISCLYPGAKNDKTDIMYMQPWTVAPQSPGNRDTSSYFSGDPV